MARLSTRLSLLVFAFVMLLPQRSHAQEIKPYVMLLFDTSGSMTWLPCGDYTIFADNSNECPGFDIPCATDCGSFYGCDNGLRDDIRIYKVKAGATSVVDAFGEVIFGLSRFHQIPSSFSCPYGGWAGLSCSGEPLGSNGNSADILVPFAENNQSEILSWMNNCDDYPTAGVCPFNTNPGSATPTTGCSLCADCGTGCDKELRGAGLTPIAGSLFTVRQHLASVMASDTKAACRPYKVILLSDGAQSEDCQGSPTSEAANLLNGVSLPNNKSVQVHVIGFGNSTLQTNLNAIASSGGTGQAVIVDNEVSLALAMANIISESILRETCNQADDDCDDACDESWPEVGAPAGCSNAGPATECSAGVGYCKQDGHYVCNATEDGIVCDATPLTPKPAEICGNSIDDDCDGLVDEGCSTSCIPQPEICNGRDDDCDGSIDEDYTSIACGTDIGECAKGMSACVNGSVVCQGSTPPVDEICDNLDNNCDTIVDSFTQNCYRSSTSTTNYASGCNLVTGLCVGNCQLGRELCTAGHFGSCQGAIGPTAEVCNNQDDDCDGQVDEGVKNSCIDYSNCQAIQTCEACAQAPTEVCNLKDDDCDGTVDNIAHTPCGSDVGECKKGLLYCDASGNEICQGEIGPTTETCNGKDDDCNGKIDDVATGVQGVGDTCGNNTGECKAGTLACVQGSITCVGGTASQAEICDGKDNDCDGVIDNNIPASPCGEDEGECQAGTTVCQNGKLTCSGAIGPSPEICDNLDNDCNGVADDNPTDIGNACGSSQGVCQPGIEQCVGGKLVCIGATGGSPEICDGLDNDCNGVVDDNLTGIGAVCGKDTGECKAGLTACENTVNGWEIICKGEIAPTTEECDGLDNNCDGNIDESFPEDGQICGSLIGECTAGKWICDSGKLVCDGGSVGTDEICDGKDNDCNGAIDDNVKGEGQPCGNSVGECSPGVNKCVAGSFICVGGVQPSEEICDGKDNDCDGDADNDAICPGTSKCIEGQCVVPCGTGEFQCPGGTECVDGYCIPNKCNGVVCDPTERCVDGQCVSLCDGVTCEDHERCNENTGLCIDNSCLTLGCPDGQTCIAYECVDNPCGDDVCNDDEMCVDGECVTPCVNVTCADDETCVQGECEKKDPCTDYPFCSTFEECVVVNGEATCQSDPCAVIRCVPGQLCIDGECIDDPCKKASCPDYLECEVTEDGRANCIPKDEAILPQTNKILAAGGGGFGCSVTSGSSNGLSFVLFVLGLAFFISRKRN